jgi:ABC-type bacteriocin/lantibiotic exporter with double-glycine peptidase domain
VDNEAMIALPVSIPVVPFYSQFADIQAPNWQKVGCGVTSLAMVIDYYKPKVSVETLLKQGIKDGAYDKNAGWTYKGLIQLSKKYGLGGSSYDLGTLSTTAAFTQFKASLKDGPVIASIHYKFDPKSTIPHLVVINGIKDGLVYYNDPAAKTGEKTISTADFLKAWKKRFIVIRPSGTGALAMASE